MVSRKSFSSFIVLKVLLLAFFLIFSSRVMAFNAINTNYKIKTKKSYFIISPEISHFRYKETVNNAKFMEDKGVFVGVGLEYRYLNNYLFVISGGYSHGRVDYSSPSSGTIDGIKDNMLEVRTLGGISIRNNGRLRVTPYTGLGYRYFNDNSAGMQSSNGAWGYERESNYIYTPLGAEFEFFLNNNWSIGITGEFDWFWWGQQHSHLEDVDPSYGELVNTQDSGYGARVKIPLIYKGDKLHFAVSPFVRYWHIDDSSVDASYTKAITGYEPDNTSTEYGVDLSFYF